MDFTADPGPISRRLGPLLRRAGRPGPAPAATQRQPVRPADRLRPAGSARRSGGGKLAEVSRGSTLNLIGAAVSAVTSIGVTVLVTRQFSPPVAGAFFSATSLFLIFESVTSLGAYTGLVYFIARLRLLGEEGRIRVVLRAAIIPVTVASVMGAVVLLVFATPLAHALLGGHLGHSRAAASSVATALRALALTLPFAALMDTVLGASRGYRDMRPSVVVNQLSRSLLQFAGVMLAAAAGGAALLAPLWAVPYIPAAAAAWIWLSRIRRRRPAGLTSRQNIPPGLAALLALSTLVRPDSTKLTSGEAYTDESVRNVSARSFWRFNAPRALAVTAQIIVQRLDIVLVGILRGPTEAAIYTAATRFLVVGQLGNIAISMAAQPQFTELFAMGARHRVSALYRATTVWVILLMWPLYLLIMVNGAQFLAIFGHAYKAGNTVLIILALSMLLSTACGQVDVVLITAGRSSWSLVNGLVTMAVNVALDLILIPHYGITGAAIAWAAAITVANLMPLAQIAITARLYPFGRGMALVCTLCVVSFGVIPLAARFVLGANPVGIVCGAAAGTVLMAAGLWFFREPLHLAEMPGFSYFKNNSART
jgi:O-antigen/teichoic acid export membrane protein